MITNDPCCYPECLANREFGQSFCVGHQNLANSGALFPAEVLFMMQRYESIVAEEQRKLAEEQKEAGPPLPAPDPVNYPPHYTSHPSGVECITVTEHMNFNIGNAVKYLWRADLKNGMEDLRKAQWYVAREIARREAEPRPSSP